MLASFHQDGKTAEQLYRITFGMICIMYNLPAMRSSLGIDFDYELRWLSSMRN
jgi:hypothetical protein